VFLNSAIETLPRRSHACQQRIEGGPKAPAGLKQINNLGQKSIVHSQLVTGEEENNEEGSKL